ncbi:MAG: glycosyltransferase family 4 protein [Methanobacteriota archaeon]|nr:MAG: glycosyltransferase family 4 protein [Euryarchaeota archaeon]
MLRSTRSPPRSFASQTLSLLPPLAVFHLKPLFRSRSVYRFAYKSTVGNQTQFRKHFDKRKIEVELLGMFCNVTPFYFSGTPNYPSLAAKVPKSDLVFCWFALGFAAMANTLARLTGGAAILVSGGWDVTGLSEIGYGRLLKGRGLITARLALATANRVLAFSSWSERTIRGLAPHCDVESVPLGVDVNKFHPKSKEDIVVCVANINRENMVRKGLATFAEASNLVPEVRFYLVGRQIDDAKDKLAEIAGPNMTFTGWLPEPELVGLLSRAKVYAQPSYIEGFGLALAEGMASGCVPVVVKSGAMPEVVGDTGFYAPYGDSRALAEAIRDALESAKGSTARERITAHFSLERRLEAVRSIVEQVLA